MPRDLIERTFPEGVSIPLNTDSAKACTGVVANNADKDVTWLHSYVTPERKHTYRIFDGPTPEAIRSVAQRNALSVDRITEVSVLDPHF